MYSIGEVSKLTGITAFTLRYYEKIGVLPNPNRLSGKKNGIRRYDDQDIRFIDFIHGLKQTGMKLEDIAAFVEDGCLITQIHEEKEINDKLRKRIDMLDGHIQQLERQKEQLEKVMSIANEKRTFYRALLKERTAEERQK